MIHEYTWRNPPKIRAIQWTGENVEDCIKAGERKLSDGEIVHDIRHYPHAPDELTIQGNYGCLEAKIGDYIVITPIVEGHVNVSLYEREQFEERFIRVTDS